jgi:hypothetical protein
MGGSKVVVVQRRSIVVGKPCEYADAFRVGDIAPDTRVGGGHGSRRPGLVRRRHSPGGGAAVLVGPAATGRPRATSTFLLCCLIHLMNQLRQTRMCKCRRKPFEGVDV